MHSCFLHIRVRQCWNVADAPEPLLDTTATQLHLQIADQRADLIAHLAYSCYKACSDRQGEEEC